jgi:hypothetical protein
VNDDELEKDLEGSGRGLILRYYSGIRQGPEENHENLNQDSRPLGQRFEPGTE